jgi:hypothetical protein
MRGDLDVRDLLPALVGVSNVASDQIAGLASSNTQLDAPSPHISRSCEMTLRIHVRDALLAALMLADTIETEDDEESEPSAADSRNAGLPAWRIAAARKSPCCADTRRMHIRREALTPGDLRRAFRVSPEPLNGAPGRRHVADNPLRQGRGLTRGYPTQLHILTEYLTIPVNGRTAAGKSTRGASQPTSDFWTAPPDPQAFTLSR